MNALVHPNSPFPSGEKTTKKPRSLITLKDAAGRIGQSIRSIYRRIDEGRLPEPIKQGNRSYFFEDEVESYLLNLERGRS